MSHLHVIGTGLIGASFALAARRAGVFSEVTGADVDPTRLQRAIEVGAIDGPGNGLSAEAVLVAVPVSKVAQVVSELRDAGLPAGSSIFDAGSAKQRPIAMLDSSGSGLPENFVPCHPMAGSELSGPDAAFADLFVGRRVFITPTDTTDPAHTERVAGWWRACGALVDTANASQHDQAVALTSHLPHLLSSVFVAMLARREPEQLDRFAGAGFADFTRIAGGDPALWRDITASNTGAIETPLGEYIELLLELQKQLADDCMNDLEDMLRQAQRTRESIVAGHDT